MEDSEDTRLAVDVTVVGGLGSAVDSNTGESAEIASRKAVSANAVGFVAASEV